MTASPLRRAAQPFVSVAKWYTNCAKQHPVVTAILTSGVKTSAADLFAQKVIEGRDEVDLKRHALFCAFGFGYLGCFQYYLYNVKFVQWCTPISNVVGHVATAPIKVFLDQAIHHPFLYFPVFYSMKAGVEGKPLSYAYDKYKSEIWDSLKALWSVWVPSQLINFAFVPRHFRVPWVAMTSAVWTVILSLMQGRFDSEALEGSEGPLDEKTSAHFAALQIHAGISAAVPAATAVTDTIVPPAEAVTPPAAAAADPSHKLLPPAAVAAAEADSAAAGRRGGGGPKAYSLAEPKASPKAFSVAEPRVGAAGLAFSYSFGPHSMAHRLAAGICR